MLAAAKLSAEQIRKVISASHSMTPPQQAISVQTLRITGKHLAFPLPCKHLHVRKRTPCSLVTHFAYEIQTTATDAMKDEVRAPAMQVVRGLCSKELQRLGAEVAADTDLARAFRRERQRLLQACLAACS
jgi:hypothetical protein